MSKKVGQITNTWKQALEYIKQNNVYMVPV